MKKLMIAAAAAAMIGSVFADAQVYDMKLSVKTTLCKAGKFTAALEKLGWFAYDKGDQVSFRKQASLTIQGVIWGCDCDTIAEPDWRNYGVVPKTGKSTVGGYAFWNATPSVAVPLQIPFVDFEWALLNRIDQMTTVEGTWALGDTADGEALFFVGAGFGKAKNASNDCASYISSMSGNFAGFIQGGEGGDDGCIFCGAVAYDCLVAPFCVCNNSLGDTTDLTAAYGSWTLKYNASASKKLKTKYYITQVQKFNTKKLAEVNNALLAAYEAVAGVALSKDSAAEIDEGTPTNEEAEVFEWDDDAVASYYVALFDLDEDDEDFDEILESLLPEVSEDFTAAVSKVLEVLGVEAEDEHDEEEEEAKK